MAALKIYNGASWDSAVAKVYDGAAWIAKMKFHDGAGFVELYVTGPQVSPQANGDANFRIGSICYAGVQFNSNGIEYEYTNVGGITSQGNWLDSGLNSEVWVERIITAGTFNSIDPGTGRHQLNITRSFRLSRSSIGTSTVTCYFKFWDAATGGNLLHQTSSANWSAEFESGA